MNPYIRSIFYLIGSGILGYGLMNILQPNEQKIAAIRANSVQTNFNDDVYKKRILEKLAKSTETKPIYLMTANELKELNKNQE